MLCKTCAYRNTMTCEYCQHRDHEFYEPDLFILIMLAVFFLLMGIGFTVICMVLSPGI